MKSQPICLSYPRQKYCESSVLWIASHFGCVIFFLLLLLFLYLRAISKRFLGHFSFMQVVGLISLI